MTFNTKKFQLTIGACAIIAVITIFVVSMNFEEEEIETVALTKEDIAFQTNHYKDRVESLEDSRTEELFEHRCLSSGYTLTHSQTLDGYHECELPDGQVAYLLNQLSDSEKLDKIILLLEKDD